MLVILILMCVGRWCRRKWFPSTNEPVTNEHTRASGMQSFKNREVCTRPLRRPHTGYDYIIAMRGGYFATLYS